MFTNEVNVHGTLNVLKVALRNNIHRVVLASSSWVYGTTSERVSENSPLNPATAYGVSKLAAEKYCKAYHSDYGLQTIALRYFNVYDPRQSANPYSGVIAIFRDRLSRGVRPIIYGDGNRARDFIHVTDVAKANVKAMCASRGVGESFNIGTGNPTLINHLLDLMTGIMSRQTTRPIKLGSRTGEIRHSCADVSKARRILGSKAEINLERGLKQLIKSQDD